MSGNQSPFSIRPIKAGADRKPKTLAEFIARVNATHPGGFRALNQADVKRQIEAREKKQHGGADSPDDHMEDVGGSEDEAESDANKDLGAARMEVLQHVRFAWIQANNALQVVSLLMSKEAPTQVMGTLDPELRNNVGIGSLGSTKLQDPPLWEEKLQDNTLVSTGAKLLAINNTANKLLAAATRLQNEMKVETEYWHEVLKIKEGGWPVSRLPNKPLTVAVKFGFSDSSPRFQANGWAELHREDDGSVNLQMPPLIAEPKQLVVSVEEDGVVTGRSSLAQPVASGAPLELRVREARNTIIAQELWHEMNREARGLLAYNVQLLSESIRYQVDDSTAVVFTFATLGEAPELGDEPKNHIQDGFAKAICTALHLLLTHAHRQSGRKRDHLQSLNSNRGLQPKPAHSIIKPIIAYVQHETWLRNSVKFVSDLTATLRLAGIDAAHFNLEDQPLPQITSESGSEQLLSATSQAVLFRIDLMLTPQARMTMAGITNPTPRGPFIHIRFMPPSPKQEAQALAKGYGQNLLGSIYQPGDSYESPRDAFQYLQGATTRALAKHFEILAAKWMADSPPVAEGSPTAWATTIKGDAIRDAETERRGVAFELLGAEEERQSGPAMSLPQVKGLKLLGDQVDLQGGIVHQVLSWSLQEIVQGNDTQPKERIEDVVQRVLMTAA